MRSEKSRRYPCIRAPVSRQNWMESRPLLTDLPWSGSSSRHGGRSQGEGCTLSLCSRALCRAPQGRILYKAPGPVPGSWGILSHQVDIHYLHFPDKKTVAPWIWETFPKPHNESVVKSYLEIMPITCFKFQSLSTNFHLQHFTQLVNSSSAKLKNTRGSQYFSGGGDRARETSHPKSTRHNTETMTKQFMVYYHHHVLKSTAGQGPKWEWDTIAKCKADL